MGMEPVSQQPAIEPTFYARIIKVAPKTKRRLKNMILYKRQRAEVVSCHEVAPRPAFAVVKFARR